MNNKKKSPEPVGVVTPPAEKTELENREDFIAKMRREMEEVRIEREAAQEKAKHDYSKDIRAIHESVDDKVVKTGEMVDQLARIAGIEVNSLMMVNSSNKKKNTDILQ